MLFDLFSRLTLSGACWSVFVSSVLYFVSEWWWFRLRYDWHKIPGPPCWPVIGDMNAIRKFGKGDPKMHEYLYYWWRKLERPGVMRRQMGRHRYLLISDTSYVQSEVIGHGGMPKRPMGLFSKTQDEKWKAVRKNVTQAFSTENLKMTFPKVIGTAQQLIEEFRKVPRGEPIEIRTMLSYFTFEIISSWGMGVETNVIQKRDNPLLNAQFECGGLLMRDALNPVGTAIKTWFPFLERAKESRKVFERLYAANEVLYDQLNLDTPPAVNDYSIAACLKRAKDSVEGEPFSEAELKSEAAIFFLAGTDSTAQQISWALCCIATHKRVQNKLAAELDSAGLAGYNPRDLDFDDLRRLPYLNAVIKESLRLIPAAPLGSPRTLQQDTKILGYRVPKGTTVSALRYILNRVDDVHVQPDVFDPARWLDNEVPTQPFDRKSGRRVLWTFSHGPRDCVGQRLAILEMQTMLALLLGRFSVELDERMGGWEGAMAKKIDHILATCKGGIWVKLIPRR